MYPLLSSSKAAAHLSTVFRVFVFSCHRGGAGFFMISEIIFYTVHDFHDFLIFTEPRIWFLSWGIHQYQNCFRTICVSCVFTVVCGFQIWVCNAQKGYLYHCENMKHMKCILQIYTLPAPYNQLTSKLNSVCAHKSHMRVVPSHSKK